MREPMKAALIGFLPKGCDPYATLESYAKAGYRAFEGADLLLQGDVKENLRRVESFGMKPLAVHINIGGEYDLDEIIRRAHAVGVTRAACYCGTAGAYRFGGRPTPPTLDDILRECEEFETAAQRLKAEGITLSFHNHDAEFKQVLGGVPVIYHMLANTEALSFEVDCGWVLYGGHDPVRFLKDVGPRLAAVHIKDFTEGDVQNGNNVMPRFTTPGTGLLPLKDCLVAAFDLGMDYAIVEQDFQNKVTELQTLTAAYVNMRETGFVE